MDKLSTKLNKNKTDIAPYQMHLPKLHENRLNLFKEIAIDFNHSLQTTLESPASLSDILLV